MLTVITKTFSELSTLELYTILQLRSEVFVVEQDCVYQDIDDKDQKALHIIGFKNKKVVAYTRIFKPGDYFPKASIGRVVVAKNERAYGYGYQIMENNEPFYAHIIDDYWNDIGTIKQYKLSSLDVLNNKVNLQMPYNETQNGWIADSCKLASSVIFEDKAVIGEKTLIEENVKFSGNNIIGKNCIIKADSRIENSIIWDNVVISENVKLDNCIIANNVIINPNLAVKKDSVIAQNEVITGDCLSCAAEI